MMSDKRWTAFSGRVWRGRGYGLAKSSGLAARTCSQKEELGRFGGRWVRAVVAGGAAVHTIDDEPDRSRQQSQFTGVQDGNTTKTINIVTRKGSGAPVVQPAAPSLQAPSLAQSTVPAAPAKRLIATT